MSASIDVPVAVITAFGSAENAVAALKAGAFDYLAKPVALEQLRALVKQALKVPEKPQPAHSYQLLGDSPAMEIVRDLIDRGHERRTEHLDALQVGATLPPKARFCPSCGTPAARSLATTLSTSSAPTANASIGSARRCGGNAGVTRSRLI